MTDYLFHILITVMIFATLGVTYNLTMGYAGIISLAHAVFFGVGGYATALLMLKLGLPFPFALLASIASAGILGAAFMLIIGRVRGDYLVIVTLGLQLVFISVLINMKDVTEGTLGLKGIPKPALLGFQFSSVPSYAALTVILCAVVIGLAWWISRSPFGRSLKALREDEVGTQSLGKNVFRYKVTIFAIAGALAGIAGSLYAPYHQYIDPYSFHLWESIMILIIVIVGGAGNLWGSVVGAVLLVSLPEALRFIPITSGFTAQIRELTFGLALLLVVFFRPQGFFGEYSFGAVRTAKEPGGTKESKMAEFKNEVLFACMNRDRAMSLDLNREKPVLEVSNLSKSFGGIKAVQNLSFHLTPAKVVGVIGPNGAGKSTLFNLICGYTKADTGEVYFKGQNIINNGPYEVARMGIGRSFQDLRLFTRLSALDNVIVALQPPQEDENILRIFSPKTYGQTKQNKEHGLHFLEGVGLADRANELAENLSYADQKLLVLARLLAVKSELLLLDELAAGLDPESMKALAQLIRQLPETGINVCLVEHSLDFVRQAVDTILFLDQGQLIAEGPTEEITRDTKLAQIYFGSVA